MEATKSDKTISVDMSEMLKGLCGDGSGMQNFAGLCGIPKDGMKVSITASAEIQVIPLEKEKCEVKKKHEKAQ